MPRLTKIVATLGPASRDPQILETLIRTGVDVVRLNFSHGKAEDHVQTAAEVRRIAAKVGRPVGILADLQGPKIRIGKFEEGKIQLDAGQRLILDAKCELGNQERVGLDYKDLPRDVSSGNILLLDDGRIELEGDSAPLIELQRIISALEIDWEAPLVDEADTELLNRHTPHTEFFRKDRMEAYLAQRETWALKKLFGRMGDTGCCQQPRHDRQQSQCQAHAPLTSLYPASL